MSNPNKRRGTAWAQAVCDLLNGVQVWKAEVLRAPDWGPLDRGDLVNTGDFVFEAKNHQAIDLAAFCDEAEVERVNAKRRWGVVVIKRRRKGTTDGYAVMRLGAFAELLKEYEQLKEAASAISSS